MTKKFNFNVDTQIANNDATKLFELYKLHKSYAAYINLLSKTKQRHYTLQKPVFFDSYKHHEEFETRDWDVLDDCSEEINEDLYEVCFGEQDEDLFSAFKNGEYLICEKINLFLGDDKIFLLPNKDKLLVIESFFDWDSRLKQYFIKSSIFEIGKHCKGKIFTEEVSRFSSSDGWDYDDRPAFAFFDEDKPYNKQITFTYSLTNELKTYDGVDIRDILTPMSFEEIACRLRNATEEKTKRLCR